MLEETCIEARAVAGARVELCTSPEPEDASWTGLIPAGVTATAQGEGDLGARLARAAKRAVDAGDWPLLIGSDCPQLDRIRLIGACSMVEKNDAFLHPTEDGGYALLGLRRFSPLLFADIPWSGPEVASTTMKRLDKLGWNYAVGELLRDIDEPADYEAYGRGSDNKQR